MPELAFIVSIGAALSLMTGIIIYVTELRKYKTVEFCNEDRRFKARIVQFQQ